MNPTRIASLVMLVVPALARTGIPQKPASELDIVLAGGRVIDPETGLDARRDVGIRDGKIAEISSRSLAGRLRSDGTKIDAKGLVVAPGFIDLHAHGQSPRAFHYRARDGVTTALELEWGYPRIKAWLESRRGKALIHYGASVAHGVVRALVMPELQRAARATEAALRRAMRAPEPLVAMRTATAVGKSYYLDLPQEATEELRRELDRGLREGALGIGVAHQYYPGASRREIYRVFEFAAERDVPIYTHVRDMDMGAMQEVIANAAATGAPLHIVHVNSMSLAQLPEVLELIGGARRRGLDVTTETYPYTAASTSIQSAIFDGDWRKKLGISYGDVQWQDTGERLTEETFANYRKRGGVVIIHMMKEEMIDLAVKTPFVMIASDAMPYARGAHPRSAGTFARVLGRYVRERGTIDLMTALRKMTIMPAKRLEKVAPAMKKKGRLQVGADADVVVFDPAAVIDTATFDSGPSFSRGIPHVVVGGKLVVHAGEFVKGVFPGRPILGRHASAEARDR